MKNIQGGIYGRTDKTKTKRYRGVGDLHSSSSCHYYHIPLFLMIGRVPSESMEPTLMVHDWLIGDRHAYEEEKPQRGDIVMFYQKDENETMVKRVIGLPGETVSFVGGKVYINGEPLDESAYLDDTVETDCGEEDKTFTVPEGAYFMLGDNREISLDARYWKHTYITTDDMKSKEILIIPFHRLPWF